jgi:gamma-glutamyltranspeptidase/glutathione hydrolase
MTPTVVLDGDQVRMVVGAAGGPTIITATAQVLLNVVDWKLDAQAAVSAPRIHDQWFPELLMIESDVPRDVVDGLERRKQKTKELPKIGVANVIVRTADGLDAGAEPRSPSTPAGD